MGSAANAPRTAVVVGAGVVGLSTAWFLQERGVDVTVVDRRGVASGASWGNAGYLAPAFSVPLPEPEVLRYGLRSLFDPAAPLYVPRTPDPGLWAFLARFARNCTRGRWQRSMRALAEINADALDAFDELDKGGVSAPTHTAPVVAAFDDAAQAGGLRAEFDRTRRSGQETRLGEATTSDVPQLSSKVTTVLKIEDQRHVDPGEYTRSLAKAVEERGGRVHSDFTARDVRREGGRLVVESEQGERFSADAVVLATGAWLPQLAAKVGVQRQVRAGRGYSFTVPTDEPVPCPVYLPTVRVACTPYQGALRVAGTMEFRAPDAELDRRRIEAIVRSARPFLRGVDWDRRHDDWVGPRPVTTDGLPLIGASALPGVHVAGGHGMWGLTLGPITGRLLSDQIVTGERVGALRPFDPLR
ncbi:FAD-dependent oxidoreductase [Saccharopolyspora rhizosphaerae]|uniref:FAD-dependent oxidoreductase n=1 Tax=Saccharopolyspora rhizosphaerae TaxID=2492662 RepID=A0A3R8P119_9PSEU|nr:FAD-dependent oxidoreductase [Saccharopolyspora rhizosphaerae]RRO14118.1 FAD-dependent oxidoreductase [Saccharopolyspora rhizosphaerae]